MIGLPEHFAVGALGVAQVVFDDMVRGWKSKIFHEPKAADGRVRDIFPLPLLAIPHHWIPLCPDLPRGEFLHDRP